MTNEDDKVKILISSVELPSKENEYNGKMIATKIEEDVKNEQPSAW